MSEHTARGQDSDGRELTSRQVFPPVAAVLFVFSATMWIPVLLADPAVPVQHPPWYALVASAAAFVACEIYPLRVEVRRETLMVSISELPLVVGVLLLPPWMVGSVYLASALAVYLVRRDNWRNDLMNLALIAAETGAAVAVVALLGGEGSELAARYLPVAAGVLVGALVSAFAVGCRLPPHGVAGVAADRGGPVDADRGDHRGVRARRAHGMDRGNAGARCSASGLAVVLGILYRTYSTFLRQHADLARMYAFGRDVTAVGSDFGAWSHLIEQVRDQLNAEVVGAAPGRVRRRPDDAHGGPVRSGGRSPARRRRPAPARGIHEWVGPGVHRPDRRSPGAAGAGGA